MSKEQRNAPKKPPVNFNSVLLFIEDCCVIYILPAGSENLKDESLWLAYSQWCKDNCIRPVNRYRFQANMSLINLTGIPPSATHKFTRCIRLTATGKQYLEHFLLAEITDLKKQIKEETAMIKILGHNYTHIRNQQTGLESGTAGRCCMNTLHIETDSQFPQSREEEALVHEIFEALKFHLDLVKDFPHETLSRLSEGFYAVMKDNPEYFAVRIPHRMDKEHITERNHQEFTGPIDPGFIRNTPGQK